MIPRPKYSLGQIVYHICPESRSGVVIDAKYSLRYEKWFYTIALGFEEDVYCLEDELSNKKTIY